MASILNLVQRLSIGNANMKSNEMETKNLDESYNRCIKNKFDSHGSPLWALIKDMYWSIKSFCSPEIEELIEVKPPVDEWLTPEEFIEKYPICSTSLIRTYVRHSPEEKRKAMSHRNSELDSIVIMPRLFFEYIFQNRTNSSFRKMNNRLLQHNYFGFNFKQGEQNGQEDKKASEGN